MEPTVIVAVVGVVGGLTGSAITAIVDRRRVHMESEKIEADANEQVRATVMMLLEPLKARITELECEIATLRAENADLKTWSEALVRQVMALGAQPVPMRPSAGTPSKTAPRPRRRNPEE